jgi:hypothetical protein
MHLCPSDEHVIPLAVLRLQEHYVRPQRPKVASVSPAQAKVAPKTGCPTGCRRIGGQLPRFHSGNARELVHELRWAKTAHEMVHELRWVQQRLNFRSVAATTAWSSSVGDLLFLHCCGCAEEHCKRMVDGIREIRRRNRHKRHDEHLHCGIFVHRSWGVTVFQWSDLFSP